MQNAEKNVFNKNFEEMKENINAILVLFSTNYFYLFKSVGEILSFGCENMLITSFFPSDVALSFMVAFQ